MTGSRRLASSSRALSAGAMAGASVLGVCLIAQVPPRALIIDDFVTMPITGSPTGAGSPGSLARVGVMREEPGGGRFFVGDLNGPLYILDKRTKAIATYLDFNGRGEKTGLFERLPYEAGYQNGFIVSPSIPSTCGTASSTRSTWKNRARLAG